LYLFLLLRMPFSMIINLSSLWGVKCLERRTELESRTIVTCVHLTIGTWNAKLTTVVSLIKSWASTKALYQMQINSLAINATFYNNCNFRNSNLLRIILGSGPGPSHALCSVPTHANVNCGLDKANEPTKGIYLTKAGWCFMESLYKKYQFFHLPHTNHIILL